MRRPALVALFASSLAASAPCLADERQLTLGAHFGFATASGTHGGPGPFVDAQLVYGLNDTFSAWATLGYTLQFPDGAVSPRHDAWSSLGVLYAFDHLRVVPYLGLGARLDLVVHPDVAYLSPSAEARGGLTYLVNREVSLDLQLAYAFPFSHREFAQDLFQASLGARYTWDL